MLARRLVPGGGGGSFTPPEPPPPDLGDIVHLTESPNGGWSFPTYPKAVYHNGVTYFGWVNGTTGGIYIGSYDHSTEAVVTTLLDTPTPPDDHNNPAILIRSSDSRILVAFSEHGQTSLYTMLSTNPEDISSFGSAVSIGSSDNHTYPVLVELTGVSGDPIYCMWRHNTSGSNSVQTGSLHYRKSTDQGATWGSTVQLYTAASTFMPYWALAADTTSIHVLTTDRDPYASDGGTLTAGHFYLDGTADTVHASDGTTLGSLPLEIGDITEVYDGAGGECFPFDGVIVAGDPRFAFVVDDGTDVSGRYARWDGAAWQVSEVYAAPRHPVDRYYGGLAISHADPEEAFAGIKTGASTSELYRYISTDDGATWDAGTAVTSGSPEHNAGPVPIANGHAELPVIWLEGDIPGAFEWGIRALVR